MSPIELNAILEGGESSSVEFKRCGDLPGSDTYETVCSFANRHGGNIFLGVLDDGTIEGVNPKRVTEIRRNLVNRVCNPNQFEPAPVIETEAIATGNGTVIRVWVPMSSSVVRFKGVAYDRMFDADRRVVGDFGMTQMYMRKQDYYYEQRILPALTLDDFRPDLIERCRAMAASRRPDHPWKHMDDDELLHSANLWGIDAKDRASGYRLAAVLLLGKDETISSVCPAYRTDALVRRVDLDRYDDRLIVRTNLVEAYDRLATFSRDRLPDRFHLEGDMSVSPRDIIVRELVANTLIHREYSSPMSGSIIIGNDGIRTKNASRSFYEGRLSLTDFSPMSKNPIIAGFFTEIGLADELGSGMRNLCKYSRIYSGKEPILEDGDMFSAFVPVRFVDGSSGSGEEPPQAARQTATLAGNVDEVIDQIIAERGSVTSREVADRTQVSLRTAYRYIVARVQDGALIAVRRGHATSYRPADRDS